MKQITLAVALFISLFATLNSAAAQCNGSFGANTACGTVGGGLPGPIPFSSIISGGFDTICSSTIGQIWVRLSSGWGCTSLGYANPVWWGADPTNTNDSLAAFNSAIAASPVVFIPPGKFKLSATFSKNTGAGADITLKGSGQNTSLLNFYNGTNGLQFGLTNQFSSVHLRDFSVLTSAAGGGIGVVISQLSPPSNSALSAQSEIIRVTLRGNDGYDVSNYWTAALQFNEVSNAIVDQVSAWGNPTFNGIGIEYLGTSGAAQGTQLVIRNSTLNYLSIGIFEGPYTQGVLVDGITCVGSNLCYLVNSGAGVYDSIIIVNSNFNCNSGNSEACININAAVPNITLANNLFIVNGANEYAALIGTPYFCTITNNIFNGGGSTNANSQGLILGAAQSNTGCSITANIFDQLAVGLNLNGGTNNIIVGNYFTLNNVNIANTGSNNYIVNNPGYNPVGAGALSPGSSPWTYTAGASPEFVCEAASTAITALTVGGVSMLPASLGVNVDFCVQVAPNQAVITTYTGTLTATSSVQ